MSAILKAFAVLIGISFLLIIAGCPNGNDSSNPGQTAGAGQTSSENGQGTGDNQQASQGNESTQSVNSADLPESIREALNKKPVTMEDLAGVTRFGAFFFPDSQLVPEKSFYQGLADNTEIYRLEFGASIPADTVIQWYRDHLEPDVRETTGHLGDGSTITGFDYVSSDRTWFKTITIKGYASQGATTISVNLRAQGHPAPTAPAGEGE
jgi:hypothetical protein